MAMTINTNIQSLNAQRNLGTSQSSLSTSMQRLSSGLRINSAKDDAAGLAIAERMSAQVRGLNQAQRNANDGVSLAQTAEGALSTIGGNLQRIRELAVQSRNATNSTEDRAALQKEVQQLKDEIGRVAKDTSFNGTQLLDGSFAAQDFQVGANQGQTIRVNSLVNANIKELGQWTSADTAAQVSAVKPTGTVTPAVPGTGSATAAAAVTYAASSTVSVEINGTAQNIAADDKATFVAGLEAAIGNGATVTTADDTTFSIAGYTGSQPVTVKIGTGAAATVNAQTPASSAFGAGSVSINGQTINYGAASSAALRTQELVDKINSNQTLKDSGVSASVKNGLLNVESKSADLVIAGSTATETGLTNGTTDFVAGSGQVGFADLDVSSVAGADNAILAMDAALKSVNSARADLGAIQNRFESVVSNLSVNSENLSASKSRITDADFAAETANLSRSQILQQAGTAMVAQANQLPQGVLSLLR